MCQRLRELGFCDNAILRCLSSGDRGIICQVCDARGGLNEQLAREIDVAIDGD